jgi:hypothetical protein
MHVNRFGSLEFEQIVPALIEGLAEAGLMGASSATKSELDATIRHLEDMRKITFKHLDVK